MRITLKIYRLEVGGRQTRVPELMQIDIGRDFNLRPRDLWDGEHEPPHFLLADTEARFGVASFFFARKQVFAQKEATPPLPLAAFAATARLLLVPP